MRLRQTVAIIDLELRVLVAMRAAGDLYQDPPPPEAFDALLDERLRLAQTEIRRAR